MFLCISNLIGIIPHALTVTSHLSVTLFLSLGFFILFNIIGICYHKQRFLDLFLYTIPIIIMFNGECVVSYYTYVSKLFILILTLLVFFISHDKLQVQLSPTHLLNFNNK